MNAAKSSLFVYNMDLPALISNLKTPIIYWYQNDTEIVLRVMISDVEDYFLRVKTDEFEFRYGMNKINNVEEFFKENLPTTIVYVFCFSFFP